MLHVSESGVPSRDIPLVVDPSRGYRAPHLEMVQGAYYVATGLWPLIGPHSFQILTGHTRDIAQARSVGLLMSVIGGVLLFAGVRRRRPSELALLAMGTAAALAGIESVNVAKRRMSPIYLADAATELVLIGLWVFRRGHLPWRPVRREDARAPLDGADDVLSD